MSSEVKLRKQTRRFLLLTLALISLTSLLGRSGRLQDWIAPTVHAAQDFVVTNTNDSGAGSLRKAISDANANPGADTISFNIPGGGVKTISPLTPLPGISSPVTIDGYTQPGSSPNTLAVGNNAVLLIELDGSNLGSGIGSETAFALNSGPSTIRGLVINRFSQTGIQITGGAQGTMVVEGCFIGTDPTGQIARKNTNGIAVQSPNTIIGGTTPAARNLISGNGDGISVGSSAQTNHLIQGNYIGTNAAGTSAIPNTSSGINIGSASQITVGGTAAGAGNVVSGNKFGIYLTSANQITVQGNYIGVDASGTAALGNTFSGIETSAAHNINIGGTAAGEGNVIAFNGTGIVVGNNSDTHKILGNAIYSNGSNQPGTTGGLGIALGSVFSTQPNDLNDVDTGANNLQNFPIITSSSATNNSTTINGTLNSEANKQYRLEFFANTQCDPSGYGEGQTFLGATDVTTVGNDATFNVMLPVAAPANSFLTATATDPDGNTSEFSQCLLLGTMVGTNTLQFSAANYSANENNGSVTITVTRTGSSLNATSVQYSTQDGTATAGSDYTTTSGTLNWASGDLTSKTFNVPITNDTTSEPLESFNVSLSNPTNGASLGAPSTAAVNINANDAPTISISDVTVTEGNAGTVNANFTVSLSGAHFQTVTMDYMTDVMGTATSGVDYQPTSGPLTFNPGDTTKQITVLVNGDPDVEPNETFFVKLSNNNLLSFADSTGMGTITDDDQPNPSVEFSQSNYNVQEDQTSVQITVTRAGNTTGATTVDYATGDKTATQVKDYTIARGQLAFAAGETTKTFRVLINEDSFAEGNEQLEVVLSNPSGTATLGAKSTATVTIMDDAVEPATNVIEDAQNFVSQQYHDFLNREPDAAGLNFWTDNITKCNDPARRPAGQTVAQCIDKQRVTTSAAFFLSPEFQYTGVFVYHFYKGSLTGAPNYDGGGVGRFPTYEEFMRDVQRVSRGIIVGGQLSAAVLEQNKAAFAQEFINRPEFKARYDGTTNALYVQSLFNVTGVTPSAAEFNALVNGLNNATETRATVLFKVVDGTVVISESTQQSTTTYGKTFADREFNRAFVLMEYFGYLRRDPDTPGFNHWLGKLNFYQNYIDAEMVRSFIISPEYRQRFGQ